jgi:tetratricopeptide (TPR) repeat protein
MRLEVSSRLELRRLGPKDLFGLLEDTLRSESLAHDLSGRISQKSDGNPFFVFEIIRGLREGQFITQREDGSWATTGVIDQIAIPDSVLDLVNARVSGLSEEERDLLDVACCWGYEFDPGLVGEVLGIGRIPLLKRFGQIERAHRLVRSAGRHYVFDHHQVQESLYASLHEQLREEYHAALARALEARAGAAQKEPESLDGALCIDLCRHYLSAAQGDAALRYLDASVSHLTAAYVNAEAASLARRALKVPGLLMGVRRAELLLTLSDIWDRLGARDRQLDAGQEAVRLAEGAGDERLHMRALHALARVRWQTTPSPASEAEFRRVLELARGCGDREVEARAIGNVGIVLQTVRRLAEAQECHASDLAISRANGDRAGECRAVGNLANISDVLGRPEEALDGQLQHLALAREIGNRSEEARALGQIGVLTMRKGNAAEGREYLERQLALSREIGDRLNECVATGHLASVFWLRGEPLEVLRLVRRELELSRELGAVAGEADSAGKLGGLLGLLGRLDEAREAMERALSLSRVSGERNVETNATLNLGVLQREQGHFDLAETTLTAGLERAKEPEFVALGRLALGSLRAQVSDGSRGREELVAARDLAAEIGRGRIETWARAELAALPGGDPQDALAALAANEAQLEPQAALAVRHLLWNATGDGEHLAEAKRLLDETVARVDDASRESMLTNIRVNREIMAACKEQGL